MKEKLEVTYRKVDDLIPYARNARTHSPEQVARIASSVKEFGWTNPILTDGQNGIIAGHGRLAAARKLGLTEVPTIELSGLSETQKRAYILADNKLALDAGWDAELLELELEELAHTDFDLKSVGLDMLSSEFGDWNSDIEPPSTSEDNDDARIKVKVQKDVEALAQQAIENALESAGIDYEIST